MGFWLMLDGGPCAGGYFTRCAPADLRAVRVPPRGRPDVLDLPDDEPSAGEDVFLYRRLRAMDDGGILCGRGGCGRIVRYAFVRAVAGQLPLFDAEMAHSGAFDEKRRNIEP